MSRLMKELGVDRLSIDDQFELMEEIRSNLTAEEAVVVPEWHRSIIAERIRAADADPSASRPLPEIRERILRRLDERRAASR